MEIGATGTTPATLATSEARVNQQIQQQNETSQQAAERQTQSVEATTTPDPNQRVGSSVDTFA